MEMVFVFLVGVAMAGVLGLIIYLYVALSRIKTRLDEHEYIFDDALALGSTALFPLRQQGKRSSNYMSQWR